MKAGCFFPMVGVYMVSRTRLWQESSIHHVPCHFFHTAKISHPVLNRLWGKLLGNMAIRIYEYPREASTRQLIRRWVSSEWLKHTSLVNGIPSLMRPGSPSWAFVASLAPEQRATSFTLCCPIFSEYCPYGYQHQDIQCFRRAKNAKTSIWRAQEGPRYV